SAPPPRPRTPRRRSRRPPEADPFPRRGWEAVSAASHPRPAPLMTTTTPTAARPRRSRLGRMPWPTIIIFLLPALALYALFVLYPIVQSTRSSLCRWNGFGPLEDFIGLDNFRDVFRDGRFRDALTHNLIIVVLSLLLQLPGALALALLLNARIKGRAVMRTVFF